MSTAAKIGLALTFCYLVAWLDRMAINIAIPFIAQDLHVGADRIGWVLSAFFLGYSLFQVPGGLLADRFGPRIVILVALVWWTTFTGFTAAATSLTALLAVRFLFGVGEGIFPASVWKMLGQWFTDKNRATANALVLSSVAIGPALTPLLVTPAIAMWGWRTCFVILGVFGLVAVVVARRVLVDKVAAEQPAPKHGGVRRELLASKTVWALFFVALTGNLTMYGWLSWLPTYLMKVKGLDLKSMAFAASLPFAFGAVGCMLAGYISDRYCAGRRKWLVLACQLAGGLALFGFTRVDDVTTFMVLQCLAGFLLFMSVGAIWALPMVLLPPRLMGAGSGLINTGGQIGGFVTNLLIGYVISSAGNDYAAGFSVLFAGLAASACFMAFGVHESRKLAVAAL